MATAIPAEWIPTQGRQLYPARSRHGQRGGATTIPHTEVQIALCSTSRSSPVSNLTTDLKSIQAPGTKITLKAETTTSDAVIAGRAEYQFIVHDREIHLEDIEGLGQRKHMCSGPPRQVSTHCGPIPVPIGRMNYDKYTEIKELQDRHGQRLPV